MLLKIGNRWINPSAVIGAEMTGPETLRIYMRRGQCWEFVGLDAAYAALRLDMLDPDRDAAPPPPATRDVSGEVPDDDDEDDDSAEGEDLRAFP